MKIKNLILGLICLLTIIIACVTTKAVRLGTGPTRPEVPENQVVVYRTADQVPGKYEEIALLSSTGEAMWTNEEQMWRSMRKKAGKFGANAIILDAMSEPGAGAKVASALFGVGGAERKGKAIAIYVFPSEAKREIKKIPEVPKEKKQVIDKPKLIKIEPEVEEKNVKIHLKDGTILKANILSQDEQTINIETDLGKFSVARIDVLKIEETKEKVEIKDVKIHLKDGTVLRAKILSEDEQKINIETSMGKFSIAREGIERIELFTEEKVTPEKTQQIIKEEKKESIEKPIEAEKESTEDKEEVLFHTPKKIEVIIDQSAVRLNPNRESRIINKVRYGTILTSTGKIGDWYIVKLSARGRAIKVTGYIHKFCVREVVEKH